MFSPNKSDNGAQLPWEYMPVAAGTYVAGQLLNAAEGSLAPVSEASNTTPGYLCMANIAAAEGDIVPVTRVSKNYIYETKLSAAAEGAGIGTKLRVSAGGLQADAGAAGTFEVTYIEGTDAGSTVHGRFI